jgi:enterochelin esterase-like enzyme
MDKESATGVIVENHVLQSDFLVREVKVDCYLPHQLVDPAALSLLLINDGQDLVTMNFAGILDTLYAANDIQPLFCVGLHCSADRKNEYGTAKILDYKGRGAKAALYSRFVFEELLPFIRKTYGIESFKEKSYAGFSLGGLSALDIVWNNPQEFRRVGVFSGSLWWRDKDQGDADFNEDTDRIMHRQIKEGQYAPWLKFFFEVGTQDETADRNNNGIIDSIDDALSLIGDLVDKGYNAESDILYLELQDGKHDVPTWASAFPDFLKWGWGYFNKELLD